MKRLGIFVLYDADGIIDDYIITLALELKTVVERLIIVVNGKLMPDSEKKVVSLADEFFFRENLGYDAGAYKDVFTKYLSQNEFSIWDEVILCNDTFVGPFYPWSQVFHEFEHVEVDFWGLARQTGYITGNGEPLAEHIQSYFIVIRKKILTSPSFTWFWRKMQYPCTIGDAVRDFETAFTVYFARQGFRYITWIDIKGGSEYLPSQDVIFLKHAKDLICKYDFPILKNKCFSQPLFNIAEEPYIKDHVTKQFGYNWSQVEQHINRIYKEPLFTVQELEEFYERHTRVYIYGHGKYAEKVKAFFNYKKWKIEKFIVTEVQEEDDDIISYNSIRLEAEDGLILALGTKNLAEVYPKVHQDYDESQILMPHFKQYDDTQK